MMALSAGLVVSAACLFLFFQIPCRLSAGRYPVKGIDVSHYQGNVDWKRIKEQGIQFAYVKATEGSTYTDECFFRDLAEAPENGIRVGAYHFFSFDSPGETQALHFIETAGPQDGKLIPAVDVEYYGDKKKNPPDGQELRKELSAMLDILEAHYACKPLLYSTQSFYHAYLEGFYDDYPLWIRNVYFPPAQDWVIWQYSDKLRLDGVNGDERCVDGDVCIADLSLISMPERADEAHEYGVFIGYDGPLKALSAYDAVVIDAQYHDAEEIAAFRQEGHVVYSYINIGSLEDFRDYHERFRDLTLGEYEHWEEEAWVDVTDAAWRDFITDELAPSLAGKGIDGFFVDNCDVYYQYPSEDVLDGLAEILTGLRQLRDTVIINGGDTFLDAYCEKGGDWKDVISGINQESVFTKILWDEGEFTEASEEDREYFCDYLERYASKGADIYLLEYTADESLREEIRAFCASHAYRCYISDSLELRSVEQ
ncbi:MAG: endo alpha-1,4 polygalactosaminidase [Lachnospiraceae bacterium]|nr:endo alpha-1,4 polygalactosaminidase [Lachnospiraceae bacterium]